MTVGPGYGGGYGTGYGGGYPAGYDPGTRAQMRAATADRDRATELLNAAYAEGRLSKDEHDARLARVLTAATFAELDAVVADLPGGRPAVPPATPRNNSMAIASLICGIGQVIFWPLITIPAIVLGHIARRQIRQTGEAGSGMATAGLILGYVGAGVLVLLAIGAALVVVAFSHGPPATPAG
ncbi:MAG TPA: DUF1707 and DUF4190 domain-containing protein [Streptosporangiaceae bacterium]